ncbi:putative membrane protein [Nannochloris sp. 'desiccata']|nr:hypothetical protein KSW81_001533 [Chlorella desiccata (nom. nud.)]KAH7616802.1 putative membrane protein [Chlorella desiccata (nom. nud.)]
MGHIGVQEDDMRPASSSSGTGTVDSGDGERVHLLDRTLNGLSSEDGPTQPFLNIITMIVMVSIHGFSIFGTILNWFKKRNGWGGWGIFIGFYTGIVALFIPGVVFILGSGFIFGFWRGLLAVWIGGALGQALAFLLARYLLRDWVENFIRKKWSKWEYIDAAIENEGWKLVLVLRLSPVIPYNLLNIAIATTSMHFWSFTIVSAIGIVFECAVFCYLGTMAESITSIASGETGPPKAIQWVLLGLSISMCVLGALMVSFMVKRAIKKAEEAGNSGGRDSSQDLAGMVALPMSDGIDGGGVAGNEEREGLLGSSTSPRTLEREGYIRSIPGLSRLAEASNAIFNLNRSSATTTTHASGSGANGTTNVTPEKGSKLMLAPPGSLTKHLRSGSKAKMSPRAELAESFSTPFKGNTQDNQRDSTRDVELGGTSSLTLSANRRPSRRSSSRIDYNSDENENKNA